MQEYNKKKLVRENIYSAAIPIGSFPKLHFSIQPAFLHSCIPAFYYSCIHFIRFL